MSERVKQFLLVWAISVGLFTALIVGFCIAAVIFVALIYFTKFMALPILLIAIVGIAAWLETAPKEPINDENS